MSATLRSSLRTLLALLAAASVAACSGSSSSSNPNPSPNPTPSPTPPVIGSFSASPDTIDYGASATLSWSVTNATSVTIDKGVGSVTVGTSVTVKPTATTRYTLTASNGAGSVTAAATVTVRPPPVPVISSFGANPGSVAAGQSVVLSWSVTNATSLSIDHGVGAVSGTSVTVTPPDTITYTLTATGPGGTATASTGVTVHPPANLKFTWVDPPAGTGKVRLVRNAASTDQRLVLDVVVGNGALNGFGVAINLPVNGSVAFTPATGLTPNRAVLDPGNAPAAAGGALNRSGPLPNVLTLGVARKKSSASDGDLTFAAGATLFTFALDMAGAAEPGAVFSGSALPATFKAAVRTAARGTAAGRADFAVGDLGVSN